MADADADLDLTRTIAPALRTPCRDRVMCIDGQVRPCLLANPDQGMCTESGRYLGYLSLVLAQPSPGTIRLTAKR